MFKSSYLGAEMKYLIRIYIFVITQPDDLIVSLLIEDTDVKRIPLQGHICTLVALKVLVVSRLGTSSYGTT